jgi:hypothetical protein
MTGESNSTDGDVTGNHGGDDCWIAKTDDNGTLQWQKSIGGSGNDIGYCIRQTTDGGYIIAGHTNSNDGDITGFHGGGDVLVAKLDNSGTIQWLKCYGGSSGEYAYSVTETADGGFIIGAETQTNNNGDVTGFHGNTDYWILKINSSGAVVWQKCLGGTGSDFAYAGSISQTSDGGCIAAGFSNSTDGDVTGNHGLSDFWVVKLNSSGNIDWQKSLGGSQNDYAYSVITTGDGGYIVAGETVSSDGDVSMNHGQLDYWVVKLNSTGAIQWEKSYGGTSPEYAQSIAQTTDGGYFITGTSFSSNGDASANHGQKDFWAVKIDNAGVIEWQKSYGGSVSESGYSGLQTSDGGFICTGWTESNDNDVSGNHGNGDYWLVKLNPFVSIGNDFEESTITFYPNPGNGTFTFNNKMQTELIEIRNTLGQIIYSAKNIQSGSIQIDLSGEKSGLYFFDLISKDQRQTGKLLVN